MKISLITTEQNYGTIDADDSSFHVYYIIIFSSYPYTLQSELNIKVQVISSSEVVFEGTYCFTVNKNSHYYVSPINKSNHSVAYLKTIINGNVNVKCHYYNYVVPSSLRSISQNYFSSTILLNVPIEEHENIMDENTQK